MKKIISPIVIKLLCLFGLMASSFYFLYYILPAKGFIAESNVMTYRLLEETISFYKENGHCPQKNVKDDYRGKSTKPMWIGEGDNKNTCLVVSESQIPHQKELFVIVATTFDENRLPIRTDCFTNANKLVVYLHGACNKMPIFPKKHNPN